MFENIKNTATSPDNESNFSIWALSPIAQLVGYPECFTKLCQECKDECKAKGLKYRSGGKECFNECRDRKKQGIPDEQIQQQQQDVSEQRQGGGANTLMIVGGAIVLILMIVFVVILIRKMKKK